MAEFTQHDAYVDTLLTNILIGYKNPLYIARDIFPMSPVRFPTGYVPRMNQSDWFRNLAEQRAAGTRSRRSAFTMDNTMTYATKWASFGVDLPDIVRDAQMDPYNLDQAAAEFATDKIMMEQELSFVSTAFTTSIWGNTDQTGVASSAGANQFIYWSNYASSTPLQDLTSGMDTIEGKIGREANTLTMGKQVWSQLKWHPDLLDLIKYTERALMGPDLFASIIGLDRVLIGRGIYTTSAEGTAEASVTYTRIWGKNALLTYTPSSPSLMDPAAGYTLAWQRVRSPLGYIKRMRDETTEVDIIEGNAFYAHKVTAANSGLFYSGAVA